MWHGHQFFHGILAGSHSIIHRHICFSIVFSLKMNYFQFRLSSLTHEHCNLGLHPIFGATYGDMDISVEVEISSINPARNSNSTMRVPHFVFTSED
jgi:hypothetical protein